MTAQLPEYDSSDSAASEQSRLRTPRQSCPSPTLSLDLGLSPAYRIPTTDNDSSDNGVAANLEATSQLDGPYDGDTEVEAAEDRAIFGMPEAERAISQHGLKSKAVSTLQGMPWKQYGCELRATKKSNINLQRTVNVEAIMMQVVGDRQDISCESCVKGAGPFVGCFTVPGIASGACGNCHFNSEGTRCNFHIKHDQKTATAANPATPVKKKGYVQEVSTPHVENARKQLAKIDFHIALPRRTPQTAANNKRRAAAVVDISEGGPENTAAEQQTTAKKGRRHNKAAAENTPARAANPLGIEFASSGYTQRAYSPTPERMPAPYPQVYTGASTAGPWGTQPAVPVFAPAPATPAATAAAIQNMPTTMNIAFPGRFTAAEARRTARMLRNMAQGLEDTADELEELKGVGYRHGV